MYAITMPRCTIDYTLRDLVQNFSSNWDELKKILPGICLHSGRTDANGGHRDWLNRTGWGFGSYHYHHKLPSHLHPNGKCPYGSTKSIHIINPYTGKKVNIGIPYIFQDNRFCSLNLVAKSLTADDNQNIILNKNESRGVFILCSTGDSTKENPGTVIFFDYSHLQGLLDNRDFETLNGNLRLLASSDGDSTRIYISLESIQDYMTKDGYFTDFSDNGSCVWSFKVRKPIVHNIIVLRNDNSFNDANEVANIGDEITVQADIEHVASARLIVGKVGPMEYKDNLENQSSVTFSKFKLTEDEIGSAAIESESLTISVNGHTGGTALDADIDGRTCGGTMTIRFENSEGLGDDRATFNSIIEFKERFGSTIAAFANKHGINPKYLEAFVYCESSNGSGFYSDGRLLIRFENYTFVNQAGLSKDLVKSDSVSKEYYRVDINSPWISIHDTPDTRYAALQWAISLDEVAAYSSISMGFPQIMGFNYKATGYNSAKDMYINFSKGYIAQIDGFMSFLENDRDGAIVKALKSSDVREAISLYNGPANVDKYLNTFNEYMSQ